MKELPAYVKMIKEVLDRDYEKGVVFYDNGEWHSRNHSRHGHRKITLEELRDYLLDVTNKEEYYE